MTDVYVAMHLQFDVPEEPLAYASQLVDTLNAGFQRSDGLYSTWANQTLADLKMIYSDQRAEAIFHFLHEPVARSPNLRFVLRHVNVGGNADAQEGFFNIWITELKSGLLGYGVFPFGNNVGDDFGVVVDYRTTSEAFTDYGAYNMNRTMIHEVGHCFGLFHTFTDPDRILTEGSGPSGSSNLGDGAALTPPQDAPTYGNPLLPGDIPDANLLNDAGDMVALVNVMNYVHDRAMLTLTSDQVDRFHFFWHEDIKDKLVTEYYEHPAAGTYADMPLDEGDVSFTKQESSTAINTWIAPVVVGILLLAVIIAIVILVATTSKTQVSS